MIILSHDCNNLRFHNNGNFCLHEFEK